ncbi:hypothetical protein M199_gp100 [Halogranum tailed virus 1]|uniref:Uncharacterized protein n=1 Tax=Halogranum tailed virus 1 TaxID=1273749 RepID=R4TH06_9CAUD|nr:hypothetical protein M199_gp100 [Halogranum tailed virus 1]AGM11566.1 hypothetical protein HGTV1_269 [Halogranum tailed virus 1]
MGLQVLKSFGPTIDEGYFDNCLIGGFIYQKARLAPKGESTGL